MNKHTLPYSSVVSSTSDPVPTPPLVDADSITEYVVAGVRPLVTITSTISGACTSKGMAIVLPIGLPSPTVLRGVRVTWYLVTIPLGSVGMVQEVVREELVLDTRETTPTPDGAKH